MFYAEPKIFRGLQKYILFSLIVIAAKLLLITRLRILLSAAGEEEEFAMLPESG
jgi:hypothetical protein